MNKIRVYEFAKELGIDNNQLIEKLKAKGIKITSSLGTIDLESEAIKAIKQEVPMNQEKANETKDEHKQEKKLINTEELSATANKPAPVVEKDKEKLSIFYRTPATEEKKEEEVVTKASPLPSVEPVVVKSSNIFSNTIAIIGIIVAASAIYITLNLYSKTWLVPQTVQSLIKTQGTTSDTFLSLENEIKKVRFELSKERKSALERELAVVKHLTTQTNGEIKGKMENIQRDMAILLNEMN